MLNENRRVIILGCPMDNLSLKETLDLIDEMVQSKEPHQHVVVNVDKLLKFRRNPTLREIISHCDIINVDGVPIIWAARSLGKPIKERVAGIDLMEQLVKRANEMKYRLFFLGARQNVVDKVVETYERRFPQLRIVGKRNGYWRPFEEEGVVNLIKENKPHILFIAMSSPKKEIFLRRYLSIMNVPFVMGVGGAFDIIAGKTKRAPKWMQKIGLEWLFRLCQEPRRLWKRYLIGNTVFIWLVIKELIKIKILKKSANY